MYNGHVDTILKAFLKIRSHLGDLAPAKAGHKNDRNLIENFSLAFAFSPKSMTARQPTPCPNSETDWGILVFELENIPEHPETLRNRFLLIYHELLS